MRIRAAVVMLVAGGVLTSAAPQGTAAQTPRSGSQPSRGTGAATASIEGIVEGPDQIPLARARVVLRSAALHGARVAITDSKGSYSFGRLPAGGYAVFVTRTGFALPYAAGGPSRGLAVQLKEGTRTNLRISLQRAGTVPGRILDEDGTPLTNAEVEAVFLGGTEAHVVISTTRSDDRGEFRLTGLPAGQYLVIARDPAFVGVADESGAFRYAPTYYPGVLSSSEAQPIIVAEGRESARAEFRLRIVRPARLSGVISTPNGERFLNGVVLLVPREGTPPTAIPSEDVEFLPDGRFAFRNVPAGTYQIRVRAETSTRQPMLFGTHAVVVDERDVHGISIVLTPGAVIQGTVEWHPSSARSANLKGVRVRAPFTDGSSLGDSLTGDVAGDGTFRIRGVMPGSHFIVVEGLRDPWTVTAVQLRGRNLLDQPVAIADGARIQGVRVIVSATAGHVDGIVRDNTGRYVADSVVLSMPLCLLWATRASPRFPTDRHRRHRLDGSSDGDYPIAAAAGLDELVARRRGWVEKPTAIGVSVALRPRDVRTGDLTELPAAALARTALR